MEVSIRLQKIGKITKLSNCFRIVAISKSQSRDSANLEILGHYNPTKKPAELVIRHEKVEKWLKQGARMSDTVKSLVSKDKKAAVPK
ncbi:MAG: 30S ribosomal protein S16 [Candidatus Omnitrophica bacterium]|nr:30S ribosomal protein S16 [Candidatus Omnitrophota bacterium]